MMEHDKHAAHGSFGARLRALGRYPVLVFCTLFFVVIFALDLATPDRARSDLRPSRRVATPAGGRKKSAPPIRNMAGGSGGSGAPVV